MDAIIIASFCIASGLSLGIIAGLTMTMALSIELTAGPYIGAVYGAVLGLLLSPFFIFKRDSENIHAVLVLCFTLSVPVALVAGFTKILWVAVALTVLSMFSVYFFSIKSGLINRRGLPVLKRTFVIPLLCIIVAASIAYRSEDKSLPNDIPALIEMMGDNDMVRNTAAARKLMVHGKDPYLIAIKHRNPNVRSMAAHWLGLLNDSSAQGVLIEASKDPDAHVRMWVAFSLGRIGDKAALPTLQLLAKDREEIVRSYAQESINAIQRR